jgi:hypothetical protein
VGEPELVAAGAPAASGENPDDEQPEPASKGP